MGTLERLLPGSEPGQRRLLESEVARGSVMAGLFGDAAARRRLGRYALHKVLGEGAHGVVFAGDDLELGRRVAVKVVELVDGEARAFLQRHRAEARALAAGNHPNIVEVFDAGVEGNSVYIVMELFEGSLESWLQVPRSPEAILDVFEGAGRGLAAVHRAGLAHRDFKPSNVLMGSGAVKVGDFGLAREVLSTLSGGVDSSAVHGVGTPAYMAPEQQRGVASDARADQFAFCVSLWEALHGQRPYDAETADALLQAKEAGPPASAQLPRWLEMLLHRGLAPAPQDRFPSMDALLEAVARGRHSKTRTRRWGLGALGLVLVSLGLAPVVLAERDEARDVGHALGQALEGSALLQALRGARDASRRDASGRVLGEIDRLLGRAEAGHHRAIAAELLLWRADVLFDLDRPLEASAALERAYFLALEGAREDLAAQAALGLAHVHTAHLEAEDAARRWLGAADALVDRVGDSDELRSRYLAALGGLQVTAVSPSVGVATMREAWAKCRPPARCSEEFVSSLLGNMGDALLTAGRRGEALETLARALARNEELYGPEHLDTAVARTRLGSAHLARGELEAARLHYARAAKSFDAQAGPEHGPAAVAASGLAHIAQARGDLVNAKAQYLRALPGLGLSQQADVLNNLGVIALEDGDLEDAILRYQSAADTYALALGPEHASVGIVRLSLGYALLQRERPGDAVPVLEEAVRIFEREDTSDGRRRGDAHVWLAEALLAAQRELPRARALAQAALEDYEALGPEGAQRRDDARELLERIASAR